MSYYVMELPMVPSGSSYQTGFETGILCAESRTTPGRGRSLCAIDLGQGIKSYACGILLSGRPGDVPANAKWVRVVVFSQGVAQGYVNVYSNIFGYRLDGGGYIDTSYGGIYYRYSAMPRPLYTPDNTSYEKWPEDCPIPLYDLSDTYDTSTTQSAQAIQYLVDQGIAWEPPPTDPYAGGGTSGPSGFPEATHDFTSDSISPPTAPTIGAYDAGFTRIYTSDETHIRALATYLWTTSVDWTQVQKLVNKPWDLIMGLNILPVTPTSEQEFVSMGNLEIPVLMGRATQQFVTVDCGTIEIPTRWGTYLDFSPYTKLEIFLPYIGMREINPDDIMGKTLGVKYVVDIMSGSCVCFLSSISEDTEGNPLVQVLYTYSGTCASQVPVTSAQYTGMMEGITQIATSIIAMQGNPTTAPVAISNIASGIVNITKPSVQRSGAISGTSGLMDMQKPYVIFTVPRMCTPEGQDKFIGYPSFITATLGDLTGYTEIEDIHLEGIPCTLSELQEIEKALKDGVIL